MRYAVLIILLIATEMAAGQAFDTLKYSIRVETSAKADNFFANDPVWRGADGAASVDMGNGKVFWLFSDGFVCRDSSGLRKHSVMIRNSIAIQEGYDPDKCKLKFYWNESGKRPRSFFHKQGKTWFWTGHGAMIRDKLIIFLMLEKKVEYGLGFEAAGWYAVLISNPQEDPAKWKMDYIKGSETFGTIAGSAAVLTDQTYLYAYGAVEPKTHEVYLLRWKIEDACSGNLSKTEWWMDGGWSRRTTRLPVPEPLFKGSTEYSVHYDHVIGKFVQVQSFGFGEARIGLRISDRPEGPWTDPYLFYTPCYQGISKPFMYSAKSHPELKAEGFHVTYNINSFDFGELIRNHSIYFPRFLLVKITKKDLSSGK